MLARSSEIIHPLGIKIETPILIPSFSSKGFAFKTDSQSEIVDALEMSKEFLTESLLVSAYDLHHDHIPISEENFCTEITIIDSGGYETSEIYDFSVTTKYSYPIKNWDKELYLETLKKWPSHKSAIIVSFDDSKIRVALNDQIACARDLFEKFPLMLGNFLIKPETFKQREVQIGNIVSSIDQLKEFPIIGITEKELGNSILTRMKNIQLIRKALDECGSKSVIHIFGSLDPITSVLYFLSGAEIFDGLTWLKYSYLQNNAIYQSNFGVLGDGLGIHVKDAQVRYKSITNNIYYLDKMKHIMKSFIASGDFKEFDELMGINFGQTLEKNFNMFKSHLK
jgi:hypothetical protein